MTRQSSGSDACRGSNSLGTRTLDRYTRAGLPEYVVSTMSGPPPETTQERNTKDTHPIPGQKLKFLNPPEIEPGPPGWKAGTPLFFLFFFPTPISPIERRSTLIYSLQQFPYFNTKGMTRKSIFQWVNVVVVVDLGFTTLLTSQVISVAFYIEREKSDKFCSEALISI